MHEFGLALTLIGKIEELCKTMPGHSVRKVFVTIGVFSNVVPEAFANAFEFARLESSAKDAELVIETQAGKLVCEFCNGEYSPDIPVALCPHCGKLSGRIVQGRELLLTGVEVEDEDRSCP